MGERAENFLTPEQFNALELWLFAAVMSGTTQWPFSGQTMYEKRRDAARALLCQPAKADLK